MTPLFSQSIIFNFFIDPPPLSTSISKLNHLIFFLLTTPLTVRTVSQTFTATGRRALWCLRLRPFSRPRLPALSTHCFPLHSLPLKSDFIIVGGGGRVDRSWFSRRCLSTSIRGICSMTRHCMADIGYDECYHNGSADFKIEKHSQSAPFKPKRALIVSKSSLFEYEFDRRNPKKHFTGYDDPRFLKELYDQNINVVDLRKRHELQQQYLSIISRELSDHSIEWRIVRRREYSIELVRWADLIISAGGDGTFLTAAKLVPNDRKPVIGINTDPVGSEGFLCLTGKSRRPADEVIRQFLEKSSKPHFRWMHRQRIRVTVLKRALCEEALSSASSSSSSIQNQNGTLLDGNQSKRTIRKDSVVDEQHQSDYEEELPGMLNRPQFCSDDEEHSHNHNSMEECSIGNTPKLALNEVFIGESHAARVSYYDVQVDNGPMIKQKSSGMTVCTGTGSTSWHYNINRLTEQNLGEIFELMTTMGIKLDREVNPEMIEMICRLFNDKLKFGPELNMMAFSVRDPVFNATFPKTLIRGFAHKILLKSRCMHAHLILDGSTSIPFNRGTEVLLEIHPEDALRTVMFGAEDRS